MIMRNHYIPVQWLISKTWSNQLLNTMWSHWNSHPTWKFLKKLNVHLPHGPAIPLVNMYPRKMKVNVHAKACAWTLITALFVITKNLEQLQCPSMNKEIFKLWCICTFGYPSSIKKRNYWYTLQYGWMLK